jgi:hypothetical protein
MLIGLMLKIIEGVYFYAFSDVIAIGVIDRKTYYLHDRYVNAGFGEREVEGYRQKMDPECRLRIYRA